VGERLVDEEEEEEDRGTTEFPSTLSPLAARKAASSSFSISLSIKNFLSFNTSKRVVLTVVT
jgi:hypothetical protein